MTPLAAKHHARRWCVQALYQWELTGHPVTDIENQFLQEKNPDKADTTYFHELLHGVVGQVAELDGVIQPHVSRQYTQVDTVDKIILRIGAYELMSCYGVPSAVVISEGLKLASVFAAGESYKFVNAILDKLAKQLRTQ